MRFKHCFVLGCVAALCCRGVFPASILAQQWKPATEIKTSTRLVPLTEMSAADRYESEDGGLYGGGKNEPPESHRAAALKELAKIMPLDAAGKPSQDGKIVFLSIGMSNTTQEFSPFQAAADADPAKNPRLVIVDGARGGRGAEEWAETRSEQVWSRADDRLKRSEVKPAQVQVIWLKQAVHYPKPDALENAQLLRQHLTTILNMAKSRYPNLRVAYLSSRTYGGYSGKHPEPESFATAFSVRWVIQDQIAGKPELNYDPIRGKVMAPLVLWGPYLWANGETPRKSDSLVWKREDFIADGVHPSGSGQNKVVALLLKYFKTDSHAKTWFLKP